MPVLRPSQRMSSLLLLGLVLWMGSSAEAFSVERRRSSSRIVPQRSNNSVGAQPQHPQSTFAQREFVAAAAHRGRHGVRLASAPREDDDEGEKSPSQPAAADAPPIMTPTERILANEKLGAAERAVVEAAEARRKVVEETSSQKYPVDLPSPLLLASAIVLAIAATGSLFSLLGGSSGDGVDDTVLGFAPTAAIVVLGLPLAIFLLYAAILKAQAETEEDDKAFLSGK